MNRYKCPACGGEQYTAKDTGFNTLDVKVQQNCWDCPLQAISTFQYIRC